MAQLPTLRERRRWAVSRTDWSTFLWSLLGVPVGWLASVVLGLSDAVKVAGAAVVSVLLVFAGQLVAKFVRAPAAILLERQGAVERERDQYKELAALVAKGQSDTYRMIVELLDTATELSGRNLPFKLLRDMYRPGSARDKWLADVASFSARAEAELRPRIKPHEWEKTFGPVPPGPHHEREVDEEHGAHLRALEGQMDGLRVLAERYANAAACVRIR